MAPDRGRGYLRRMLKYPLWVTVLAVWLLGLGLMSLFQHRSFFGGFLTFAGALYCARFGWELFQSRRNAQGS